MNLIINHTIRSARKNIVQILVIVMAVMVATVMLFASFTMSDIFYNINMLEYARTAQGADMLVGNNSADVALFSRTRITQILGEYEDDIEYSEYFLKLGTVMCTETSSKAVQVEATDLKTYFQKHQIAYVESDSSGLNELKNVVVSKSFAEEAGLSVGDDVEIFLATYDMYIKVNIAYIAKNEGIFSSETAPIVLMDLETVGNGGQVSAVYVTFKDSITDVSGKIEEIKKRVKEDLPQVGVQEGDSESTVREIVEQNTRLFTVGLLFIVAIMMLILLTSYQIIARHRLGEMVTFKAVGATPIQTALIMVVEVVLYAAIGAGLGVLCGRLAMQIAVNSLIPMAKGAITFDAWKYIVAFVLGIIVAIVATLIPIISTGKKTIRELTASEDKGSIKKENPVLCGVSYAILIGIMVVMHFVSDIFLIVMTALLLVAMAFAVKFSVGYVLKGVGYVAGKIARTGPQKLASIEVSRNKAMRTITLLISILIAFSFMVVEVVDLVKTSVEPFRGRYDADIVAIMNSEGKITTYGQAVSSVLSVDGVEKAGYFNSRTFLTSLETEDDTISMYGVSDYQTLTMCCAGGLSDGVKELWDKTDFPIVISQEMSLRMGWDIGDEVELTTYDEDYHDVITRFTVVGIDYTYSEWDVVGYCRFGLLENRYGVSGATYLIKTDGTSDNVFLDVREYFDGVDFGICYVLPFEEWAYAGKSVLSGVSALLTVIQVAIYLVSILGVINIAVVTVFDRRKEIALYKLCGMTGGDYRKFSLTEGVTVGVSGGVLGIVVGIGINQILPIIGTLIAHHMDFGIFPASVGYTALIVCAFFAAIWLVIAIFNRNVKAVSINERFK